MIIMILLSHTWINGLILVGFVSGGTTLPFWITLGRKLKCLCGVVFEQLNYETLGMHMGN